MANEPGAAILATFDQLINRVKQAHPVRSDGKPLGGGVVYSTMVLGMPVDPEDYLGAWSPAGASTLQDMASQGTLPNAGAAPAPATSAGGTATGTSGAASAGGASALPPAPAPDPKFMKAMSAAFKTAQLCTKLLQVTTDGSYLEYPTGKHLDFAYEGIISAMQPLPMPPIAPDVQKQINDAQAVLYDLDTDGSILGKSKLYKAYEKNALAYAMAKSNYAAAMADARTDPAKAQVWPMQAATYQEAVDDAYDTFKTEGAEKIERALDVIGSVGVCMQDHMITKARQLFDAYNLGLAGVPAPIPWSYIDPSGWCDPDNDDDGWQQLTVTSSDYQNYDASNRTMGAQGSWSANSSSTGGGGGVMVGFAAFGGSGASSSSNAQGQGSSQYQFTSSFKNTAKQLTISLEYALCTINRPWLVSDLFYMGNWYLVGNRKNCVSDGTEKNQANLTDISKLPLLPMIPQQMLVIRNVVISAKEWGSDGEILNNSFGASQDSSSSSASNVAGSGGVCLGFVSFGGTASHQESNAQGQSSSWSASGSTAHYGATFDGSTLKIPGAQIIAFLSDIVPATPPLDDPSLPQPTAKKTSTVSAATLQPASA